MTFEMIQWYLVPIAVISSVLIVGLRTYISKKAENLATKEDLEALSRLTEEIRASVANLEWFRQEEVKAILDFYDASSQFLLGPLNRNWRQSMLQLNPTEISTLIAGSDEIVRRVSLNYYRLLFYGASNLVLVSAGDLANSCIRAAEIFDRHLPAIRTAMETFRCAQDEAKGAETAEEKDPCMRALVSLNDRIHSLYSDLTPEKEEAHVSFSAFLQAVHKLLSSRGIDVEPLVIRVFRGTPERQPDEENSPLNT